MKSWKWVVFCAFLVGLTFVAVGQQGAVAQQQARANVVEGVDSAVYMPGPYEVVPNWPQPLHPDGSLTWGRFADVFAESPNRVYAFQTGEYPPSWRSGKDPKNPEWPQRSPAVSATYCAMPGYTCTPGQGDMMDTATKKPIPGSKWEHLLLVLDANGKLIESWEQHNHLFTHPHGVLMDPKDPERHVWLLDDGSEQIFKFTHDGKKLVMTLGEFRVKGNDKTHLGGPNGIAFLPNGDFYVSDGYKNSRVVKFSKDGKYLMEWGTPGTGPGQFHTTHSVGIGPDGRLYVGDRGNLRDQIFDQNGKYLSEIRDIYPNALGISKDQQSMWVAQGGTAVTVSHLWKYDLNGKLLSSWSRPFGVQPDQLWGIHGFSTDSDGNVYVALSVGGRVVKYRPKKGADPKLLIGQLAKNSF